MALRLAVGAALVSCILGEVGCRDFVSPDLTEDDVSVHVNEQTIAIKRLESGAFDLDVPLTLTNNTARSIYWNGFCASRLQRLEGTTWQDVGPWICSTYRHPLNQVPPASERSVFMGRQQGGPGPAPEFARAGTYRLQVFLYFDSKGERRIPRELEFSNTFEVTID